MEVRGQLQAQAAYPLERTPVPIEYDGGWAGFRAGPDGFAEGTVS